MQLQEYPEWKDSAVEWLGEIPEHWEISKFRFMFQLGRGLGITKKNLIDEGVPCVNYGEIHSKFGFEGIPEEHDLKCVAESYLETSPNALLAYGDFVYADTSEDIEGSGNFTHLNSNKTTFAGYHTVIAKPLTDDQPRYLAYLFDSELFRFQVRKAVSGVKVFSITQDILKSCYVWLPPVSEQKIITKFLDYKTAQIDRLIEKKKALIEKLNEQRIAMIIQAVTKGLNPESPMKDSEVDWLGEVPAHWEVTRLRFLLRESLANGVFKKAEFWGEGTRVINVTDVYVPNDIIKETCLDRLLCDEEEQVKYSARHGDFFLVRSSLKLEGIGKSATVLNPRESLVFECHVVRGRPNLEKVNPRFLNLLLNSRYAISNFIAKSNVVTMATIDQEKFKSFFVPLPPIHEQESISKQIDVALTKIDSMIVTNNKTIEKLNEYRTALITAAVTGKIDVRQVEIPEEI